MTSISILEDYHTLQAVVMLGVSKMALNDPCLIICIISKSPLLRDMLMTNDVKHHCKHL